jgi:hypothetical protein
MDEKPLLIILYSNIYNIMIGLRFLSWISAPATGLGVEKHLAVLFLS